MKTILVATDFSAAAMNAAVYAAEMAVSLKADILLFHSYDVPVSYSEIPAAVSLDDIQVDAEKQIEDVKKQLSSKAEGKLTITSEVRMGEFFAELKKLCEKVNPYLVIMGSQGTTAAERLLFGNHAVYAMKHLKWPLITVPKDVKFSAIRKIGLACDFDEVVNTIPVTEIKTLLKDFNAALHIVNTGKQKTFNPDIVFESGLLQEMLGAAKPNYHFISADDTDEGIIRFTEEQDIDLLIVLPKRHSLLEKMVHKSHTKQLVLHSHVPVMALHQG